MDERATTDKIIEKKFHLLRQGRVETQTLDHIAAKLQDIQEQ